MLSFFRRFFVSQNLRHRVSFKQPVRQSSNGNDEEMPETHYWKLRNDGAETSCLGSYTEGSGLVLGVYPGKEASHEICMTKTATIFNNNAKGRLIEALKAMKLPKVGEVRILPQIDPNFDVVAVAGLGDNEVGYVKREARDEAKENLRKAVGAAVRNLQDLDMNKIYVEGFEDPESAAEGAYMAAWENHHLMTVSRRTVKSPDLILYGDCDMKKWRIGMEKAEAQNFARKLMETPPNLMTPRLLAHSVVHALCKTNVNVTLRGERWMKDHNMNAFLENTKGSAHNPILVELSYYGCDTTVQPVVLIGKGITFNSGGLCLKTCEEMKHTRGDMSGAAVVVAAFKAVARLGLPMNIVGLLALGENMPGGTAGKPMDIVKSSSGKSILVSPRDFGGSLMLADAICYAQRFNPKYIVSVATLTKEIQRAFHLSAAGVFTKNEKLWQLLKTAGIHSGDRLWKCPLWKVYEREVMDSPSSDLTTFQHSLYPRGFGCTNAAFLNQFNYHKNWAHVDTYGTMMEDGKTSYLKKGMSGRPTRTIIEFLGQIAYPPDTQGQIPPQTPMPDAC